MGTEPLKIAVVGAGGVGGFFGGRLATAGQDVRFVARGAHLAALERDGLTLIGPDGAATVTPVHATGDPGTIGPADVVLVSVKTWQLPATLTAIQPLTGPDTAVVTLQNGVEAPGEVADAVGRHAVLPGVAKVIAFLDGPGRIRHVGGLGSLTFAEWDNRVTPRAERLHAALTASGVPSPVAADIWAELWAKFLFVAPSGGLGAVTGATLGTLRSRPGTRRLLADAITEVERLARATGVHLPDDIVASTLTFIDLQPPTGTTSLHRDIAAGLPSELEAWTGAVVRLAAKYGVETPVNTLLYEVLSVREDAAQ